MIMKRMLNRMLRYADAIVKRGVDKLIDAIGHSAEPQTKNAETPQPQKRMGNDTDCAPQTTGNTMNCGLTEQTITLMDELYDMRYNVLDRTPEVQRHDPADKGLVSVSKPYLRLLKNPTRDEAAEKCPDARRVAPISACVFYQIDRLKSGFEAMGRTVMPGICALMGATRPASVFSAASSRGAFFSSFYFTQIEEEIQQHNRLCYQTSPPLVLAFLQCVSGNFPQNVISKKSILNTQPCGSVFEFAPTDNRHEVTVIGVCALHVFSPSVPCGSPSV